jgi:actin-related protein
MENNEHFININDINKKPLNFKICETLFNGKNSTCRSLKVLDNQYLIIKFDGIINIFNKCPRCKNLIRVDNNIFDLFKQLLLNINKDTNSKIIHKDYLYESKADNKFVIIRLPGNIQNNKVNIFTKIYDICNDGIRVNINNVQNNFYGTFIIKIRGILYDNYNNKNEELLVADFDEIYINKYFNME